MKQDTDSMTMDELRGLVYSKVYAEEINAGGDSSWAEKAANTVVGLYNSRAGFNRALAVRVTGNSDH